MTVNVKTNNNGKTLAEISNISNPNLLINTDFSKVIHQRGAMPFTTYNNAYSNNPVVHKQYNAVDEIKRSKRKTL